MRGRVAPLRRGVWLTAAHLVAHLVTHHAAHAQGRPTATRWNDPQADTLVQRAIARRGLQLADSTLLSYAADAHGFLAFLAQLGDGGLIPPKVVQSEELALQVSWWQPGRSAQRLVGRRDTTLLPARVAYYRDRYGVVLDNLPDRIRLGDGQDVRDVPHPLAAGAPALYEYALGSPLRIRIPGREILVDEVQFRPRDPSQPSAIGSVYLDRASAAVVRLSMTFTRAAMRDQRIETLVVTLENGLVRERYWLPRRQEVEVMRGSTWFDIPARGIVRGRWEIGGYVVNERIAPAVQQLPRWSSAPRDSLAAHPFTGRVVDILPPEIQLVTTEDAAQARIIAEQAVRTAMLSRPASATVTGRGISDLARFNRAEGLAVGAGFSHRNRLAQLAVRGRYGFADGQAKGFIGIGPVPAYGRTPTWQLFAERDYRDLGFAERAGVTNSLGALLFGSDYSTQVDTRALGVLWRRTPTSVFRWRLAYEADAPVAVQGRPLSGDFAATLRAWEIDGVRAEVQGSGSWSRGDAAGTRAQWRVVGGIGAYRGTDASMMPTAGSQPLDLRAPRSVQPLVGRLEARMEMTRPLSADRALVGLSHIGVATGRDLPPQWMILTGGPWSSPGYGFHQFANRFAFSQRVEFRQPLPAPSIPLGRYGRAPGRVTLAPFAQAIVVGDAGVYPSAGIGMLFFYDLLRADIARGVRDGRWRFAIDIDRGFWGML